MNLKACIIAYGRKKSLKRCIDSVLPHVSEVIVIDGRISGYFYDFSWIKLTHPKVILDRQVNVWQSEARKRSQYLKYLKEGDWFLYIDSDEILETPIDSSKFFERSGLVKLSLSGGENFVLSPRILRYKEGIKYETHYLLSLNKEFYINQRFLSQTFNNCDSNLPYACTIRHTKTEPDRKESAFKKAQRVQEKQIEKEFRKKGDVSRWR